MNATIRDDGRCNDMTAEREAYRRAKQAELDEHKAKIDAAKAKLRDQTEAEAHKEIDKIEHRLEEARKKLQDIAHAGEDMWEEIKTGIEMMWDDLSESIAKILTKLG